MKTFIIMMKKLISQTYEEPRYQTNTSQTPKLADAIVAGIHSNKDTTHTALGISISRRRKA